jgi:hypothetical protein
MRKTQPRATLPVVRCAVYTRKSTDEGLEQEFNSLDAQREAGDAFVRSQAGEGWTLLPDRYDDGGFTGGNMDRPALQRLMADIEAGRIDCVVVYKVDRLSRSLLDFARMMETFEKYHVSFVSVTQQFNRASVRVVLRNRARYEVANNSYARGIVLTLANDVVGTGPRLQMLTADAEASRLLEREFAVWAKAVNLAEKLRTMRMARAQDGEAFAVMTS